MKNLCIRGFLVLTLLTSSQVYARTENDVTTELGAGLVSNDQGESAQKVKFAIVSKNNGYNSSEVKWFDGEITKGEDGNLSLVDGHDITLFSYKSFSKEKGINPVIKIVNLEEDENMKANTAVEGGVRIGGKEGGLEFTAGIGDAKIKTQNGSGDIVDASVEYGKLAMALDLSLGDNVIFKFEHEIRSFDPRSGATVEENQYGDRSQTKASIEASFLKKKQLKVYAMVTSTEYSGGARSSILIDDNIYTEVGASYAFGK